MAKEEAVEANKAISEFLANISHELRNLMHQILSYTKYGIDLIGCSGARIMVTLLTAPEKNDAKRGLASLCIGGGISTAMVVERP